MYLGTLPLVPNDINAAGWGLRTHKGFSLLYHSTKREREVWHRRTLSCPLTSWIGGAVTSLCLERGFSGFKDVESNFGKFQTDQWPSCFWAIGAGWLVLMQVHGHTLLTHSTTGGVLRGYLWNQCWPLALMARKGCKVSRLKSYWKDTCWPGRKQISSQVTPSPLHLVHAFVLCLNPKSISENEVLS